MRTIGTKWPDDAPEGDYQAVCDYCGVPWQRSKMVRDGAGLLMCPDEQEVGGMDAVTAELANAEALSRPPRERPVRDQRPPLSHGDTAASVAFDYSTVVDMRVLFDPAEAELDADGHVDTVECAGTANGSFANSSHGLTSGPVRYNAKDERMGRRPTCYSVRPQGTRLVYSGDDPWEPGEHPYLFWVARLHSNNGAWETGSSEPNSSKFSWLMDIGGFGFLGTSNVGLTSGNSSWPWTSKIHDDTLTTRYPDPYLGIPMDARPHVFEYSEQYGYLIIDGEPAPAAVSTHLRNIYESVGLRWRPGQEGGSMWGAAAGFSGLTLGGNRTAANNVESWHGSWGKVILSEGTKEAEAKTVRKHLMQEYNIPEGGTTMRDRFFAAFEGYEPYLIEYEVQ